MFVITGLLPALITVLLPQGSSGALLFYDGFDYPMGKELGVTSSAVAWDNDKSQFTIVSGSLEYAGLKTSTGNRVSVEATLPSLDSVRTVDGAWRRQTTAF